MLPEEVISVSEFIDLFNQTLEFAYPSVVIEGELANLRISKNKWLYFDLKDEHSSLKFFGTVYSMTSALEDGMMLRVGCYPRMHSNYGFSMQVQSIQPVGEGSIKRSAQLLEKKLRSEGLFLEENKRAILYPPNKIGLITSAQSAAYADFIKVTNSRWQGLDMELVDVQVQGELAISQIITALKYFNSKADDYDAVVIIRGGGSPEDLAAFSSEPVTRAVANSLIPTLVAIGHEIDVSLAELAADMRASTPSNAAELLVPDRRVYKQQLVAQKQALKRLSLDILSQQNITLTQNLKSLKQLLTNHLERRRTELKTFKQLIESYNPRTVLARGYSIVRQSGKIILKSKQLEVPGVVDIQFSEGAIRANISKVRGESNG